MDENKGLLSHLPESGVLLTISVIGCYIIGYFYVSAIFGRFGISLNLINLPFTNYLTMSVLAIMLAFLICVMFIFFNEIPCDNKICCFFANIPLLIYGVVCILFTQSLSQRFSELFDSNLYFGLILIGLGLIIGFVYTIYIRYFLFRIVSSDSETLKTFKKSAAIFILLISLAILSMYLGYSYGTNVIEGDPHSATSIQLYLTKDIANISGNEMILIAHSDEKYYVINKEKPAPTYPKIFVISDSDVKLAILTTNLSTNV
jgi:hypothetical protein